MSARGRRPNQAGIAALARSTAPRAASSIARRERNVKAAAVRNRSSSAPTSRVRNERRAMTRISASRSEEHTSELQSHSDLVCRLLLEKKKNKKKNERTEYN